MLFYNYFGNFSYLVTYQRNIFFFVVSISLIIIFTCISSLPLASAQSIPSISPSIGVGSKFQVIVEGEVRASSDIHREVVVGEVQLYPGKSSSLENYFEIRGFGLGTLQLASALDSCKVNYNSIIIGSIVDQRNGYSFISISAHPISSAKLSQDVSLVEPDDTDVQQYLAQCGKKNIPWGLGSFGFAGGHANATYSNIAAGINVEEKIVNPYDPTVSTLTKMSVSPPALKYDIFGTVRSDNGLPVSNSKIVMIDAEELKKKFGNSYSLSTPLKLSDLQLPFEQKTAASDDKNAKYNFTINGKGKVLPTVLVVSLLWYDKEKGGGGEFAVTTGPEQDGKKIPIYMISCVSNLEKSCQPWKPNKAKDGFEAELNFFYGDIEHLDLEKEGLYPRSPSWTQTQYDAAYVYYNSYKAIKYFESLKGKVGNSLNPLIIDIYDSVDEGCINKTTNADRNSAFYSYDKVLNIGGMGTNLDPIKATGGMVTLCKLQSSVQVTDAPENREYHELGHYLQRDMYYSLLPWKPDRGKPHAGYANSETNDSLVEGFANFISLLVTEYYSGTKDGTTFPKYKLDDTYINFETDYKVWGENVRVHKLPDGSVQISELEPIFPDDEEYAVTGILWDLHDKGKDIHLKHKVGFDFTPDPPVPNYSPLSTVYNTLTDQVSIADADILKSISGNTPMNLVELYKSFSGIVSKKDLDMVFIIHGAFGDTSTRDLIHNATENIGYSGDKRPGREGRMKPIPQMPGSYIIAHSDSTFKISMIHEKSYSNYDFSYTVNMSKGALTYFQMSPSYYPSKAVFDQLSSNGNKTLAEKVLVIDSDDYWNYIHSNPDDNSTFKDIPVPVAVPRFPPDRSAGLNITSQTVTNNTYNEKNTSISTRLQRTNIPSSITTNFPTLNPNSSYNMSAPTTAQTPTLTNNNASTPSTKIDPVQSTTAINLISHAAVLPSSNDTQVTTLHQSLDSDGTIVTIGLPPNSLPLFFECNVTKINGSSTLPGLNATASAIQALTDGNPNTQISGNVTFDIKFEKPFIDKPGPDLIVYGADQKIESSSITFINGTESGSPVNFVGSPSPNSDSCGNPINAFKLDIAGMFPIPVGSIITGLRINNDPDNNGGAHISDIAIANFGIP
jgi:hypothetical protein